MRRLLAAAVLLCAGTPAIAADGASLNVIGFSPDSKYFAFEQYGIQDASGFPYWDVFVLDLEKNQWVKDSPLHVVVEDETKTVSAAHAKAKGPAAALMNEYGILEPPVILAATPATEVVADRTHVVFDRSYTSRGAPDSALVFPDIRYELKVETKPMPLPGICDPQGGPYFGFTLSLQDFKSKTWHAIYADDSLPASRGCILGYDLAAVAAQQGVPGTDRLVAIVGVYAKGFEGADHRYIAVPFVLPK